jgi:hypothetical protein
VEKYFQHVDKSIGLVEKLEKVVFSIHGMANSCSKKNILKFFIKKFFHRRTKYPVLGRYSVPML